MQISNEKAESLILGVVTEVKSIHRKSGVVTIQSEDGTLYREEVANYPVVGSVYALDNDTQQWVPLYLEKTRIVFFKKYYPISYTPSVAACDHCGHGRSAEDVEQGFFPCGCYTKVDEYPTCDYCGFYGPKEYGWMCGMCGGI